MAAHLRLVTAAPAEDEDGELSPEEARKLAAFLRKVAQLGPAQLLRMAAQLDRLADG